MAFAGRCGLEVDLPGDDAAAALFNEEVGAVLQIRAQDERAALQVLEECGLGTMTRVIGNVTSADRIRVSVASQPVLDQTRTQLRSAWSETSFRMQELRDNPACAREQFEAVTDPNDPGLNVHLTFNPAEDVAAHFIASGIRPRVAILREQGVNSQSEMAAAFYRAGFAPIDVHMTDLLNGRLRLSDFKGLIACGGFSYGDVLGAGEGWAKSIMFHTNLRDAFARFFTRHDSFALGVCNGCQMFAALRSIIPGTEHWPRFVRNRSEQFEARLSLVEVTESGSLFFAGMQGSRLPIAVSHGEGFAEFATPADVTACETRRQVSLRFVDNYGRIAERYPANPNGSPRGITAVTSDDGRITAIMPHPERVYRAVQNSWRPDDWAEDGGWMRMFRNARAWVG
jgi:phosphoribosylformylglycinamidine synthase